MAASCDCLASGSGPGPAQRGEARGGARAWEASRPIEADTAPSAAAIGWPWVALQPPGPVAAHP